MGIHLSQFKTFLAVLFLSAAALAQNSRIDQVALGPRGPIPAATVAICTQPANTSTQPCSPLANLCSSLSDAVCTQPNPVTADSLGNYHFYIKQAQSPFTMQIYGPQVAAPLVIPDQTVPLGATSTAIISGKIDGTCYLDGTVNTTLAQALTCAAGSGTVEVAPSAGTVTVPSSTTVPAGVTLRVDQGAKLSIAAGQTLTDNGPTQIGTYQAFVTSGTGSPVAISAATEATSGGAVAITVATETGNLVTITSTLQPAIGSNVIITGVTPGGYNSGTNGGWTVVTSSSTQFTYFNTTTGLGVGTVFGTAQATTNTVTIASTLSAVVGMPVTISGVTPSNYNGNYLVLTSTPGVSFTVFNALGGLSAGSAFGTATMGGAVQFGSTTEGFVRPEWFGAVADGTGTPITGTDNYPALLSAQAALPVYTLIAQGTKLLANGQLSRSGRMMLSVGHYVISQPVQPSLWTTWECPSYENCVLTLKNGIATTGPEYWTAIVYPQNGQSSNSAFGAQFRDITVDCNGGGFYGTNTLSSGLQFAGVQGSSLGILKILNCGQRGLWLAPNQVNPASGANGPNDIWVTGITVGPGIQLDASITFFASIRAEIINQTATYSDIDGDPNPAVLIGSLASGGAGNLAIGELGLEFDGLPLKIWNGQAITINNITAIPNIGGQNTMAIISHGAQSVSLGAMYTFAPTPQVFTNFVVDRTTTPTTNIAGNFGSFPSILGYSNAGVSPFNALQLPEISSAPANLQKAAFDGCYADSTAHGLKCSYNNGSFFNATQTIGSGTSTTNGTGINTLTCQAQPTITVTGATTSDVAQCSLNAALPATWQTGIVLSTPSVTSNTVTYSLCNPTATATITPAATAVRCTVTR